jgi:hypothetical protein
MDGQRIPSNSPTPSSEKPASTSTSTARPSGPPSRSTSGTTLSAATRFSKSGSATANSPSSGRPPPRGRIQILRPGRPPHRPPILLLGPRPRRQLRGPSLPHRHRPSPAQGLAPKNLVKTLSRRKSLWETSQLKQTKPLSPAIPPSPPLDPATYNGKWVGIRQDDDQVSSGKPVGVPGEPLLARLRSGLSRFCSTHSNRRYRNRI